jgi:hypothetical protein
VERGGGGGYVAGGHACRPGRKEEVVEVIRWGL